MTHGFAFILVQKLHEIQRQQQPCADFSPH
jgi:hypothetical protein